MLIHVLPKHVCVGKVTYELCHPVDKFSKRVQVAFHQYQLVPVQGLEGCSLDALLCHFVSSFVMLVAVLSKVPIKLLRNISSAVNGFALIP